jgi:hypothetical protein
MTDTQTQDVFDPVGSAVKNATMAREQVESIDEQLDLADNASEIVRRNAAANNLIVEFSDQMKELEDSLKKVFADNYADPAVRAAAFTHAGKVLAKEYGKDVKETLDAKAKEMPSKTLTADERQALENQRIRYAKLFKYSKEIITGMGEDIPEDLKSDLKIRRAGGSRGPNPVGTWDLMVERKEDSNDFERKTMSKDGVTKPATLSLIANTVCKELGWQTRDLKNFIVAQLGEDVTVDEDKNEITFKHDSWVVKLPAPVNRKLKGVLVSDVSTSDEDEDDTTTE